MKTWHWKAKRNRLSNEFHDIRLKTWIDDRWIITKRLFSKFKIFMVL